MPASSSTAARDFSAMPPSRTACLIPEPMDAVAHYRNTALGGGAQRMAALAKPY
jgi:hypothetical protein